MRGNKNKQSKEELKKLTDPMVPSKMSDFIEALRSLGLDIDDEFIIQTIKGEGIVPVTDHPLHQKKVLSLAAEFYGSGFTAVGEFLVDNLLEAPELSEKFRKEGEELKKEHAKK